MPDPTDNQLYAHVLGEDSPCGSLVESGVFPVGWVDRYLTLLAVVSDSYADSEWIPRRVTWAVHFASWYLAIRYDVWRSSATADNAETLTQLSRIRTPSELFLGADRNDQHT